MQCYLCFLKVIFSLVVINQITVKDELKMTTNDTYAIVKSSLCCIETAIESQKTTLQLYVVRVNRALISIVQYIHRVLTYQKHCDKEYRLWTVCEWVGNAYNQSKSTYYRPEWFFSWQGLQNALSSQVYYIYQSVHAQ